MNFIKRTWAGSLAGKVIIGLGGLVAACLACSVFALIVPTRPQQRAEATVVAAAATVETVAQASAAEAEAEAEATTEISIAVTILASPAPTHTPAPTETPAPTNTPEPTSTPEPTPTPVPPVVVEGRGDDVIDITKDDEPMLLTFTHAGRGNFAVESFDADGNRKELLVNAIGNYRGTLLIDILADELKTTRLAIQADGNWGVTMSNLGYARYVELPGTIVGSGSEVFFIGEGDVDLLKFEASGKSNFVVFTFSDEGRDLLVNEIAPYSGIKPVPRSTRLVTVEADGGWRIEVTAR